MTNEEIVEEIQNGYSVTANMELLYTQNLPLLKKFVKPYANYEPEEDLLQECYFGLVDAVQHYKAAEGVLFMTYAEYRIRQRVKRYLENCGSVIRLPSYYRQKISRYKKTVQEFQQFYNRVPTDAEIAVLSGVTVEDIHNIRVYMTGTQSIDVPLQNDTNTCLADTIESDFDLENSVIDKIHEDYQKNELWGIVERYTDRQQAAIITEHYKNGLSLKEISQRRGCSVSQISRQRDNGLQKLRTGKAVREIREKLEFLDASAYRTGIAQYKRHNCTSTTEYIAIRRAELKEQYKQVLGG